MAYASWVKWNYGQNKPHLVQMESADKNKPHLVQMESADNPCGSTQLTTPVGLPRNITSLAKLTCLPATLDLSQISILTFSPRLFRSSDADTAPVRPVPTIITFSILLDNITYSIIRCNPVFDNNVSTFISFVTTGRDLFYKGKSLRCEK